MTDARDSDGDDVARAGEYALHLMDAQERRAFERRLASEPALRALVREWDEGLVPLADAVAEETPPKRLKGRIEVALFDADASGATASGAAGRGRSWRWPAFLGGALAAAVLAAVVVLQAPPLPDGPLLTAEIAAEDRSFLFLARLDAAGALEVERLEGAPPEGRTHELWLIAEGAEGPVSLGLIPEEGLARIALPERLAAALPGATLAVSDEPAGGSPTGQPTGPVLALGRVEAG